ncbi:MAG: uracil-DNA glycosylase [Arsenophonus sp.]|nr:MAG: uracil-DNA glycosylase [Arsenophonus sp.]
MIYQKNSLTWKKIIDLEKKKKYFIKILNFLYMRKKSGFIIYPSFNKIFNAFYYTKFNSIKVVIIGQDPYHGKDQANGLCFSVNSNIIPPSLRNIFIELENDMSFSNSIKNGNLAYWAKQGVLLLNSVLTVEEGRPNSHMNIGWEIFTNKIISIISHFHDGVIFLLWGKYAQKKVKLINTKKHFILKASHPSPFSVFNGFFGCKHFTKTNYLLVNQKKKPIDWYISN